MRSIRTTPAAKAVNTKVERMARDANIRSERRLRGDPMVIIFHRCRWNFVCPTPPRPACGRLRRRPDIARRRRPLKLKVFLTRRRFQHAAAEVFVDRMSKATLLSKYLLSLNSIA